MTPLELLALVAGVLIAAVPAIWAVNRAWSRGFDAGYVKAMWDTGEMERRLQHLDDPENGTNLSAMTDEEVRKWLADL